MESTHEQVRNYHHLGMLPKEISDTLGVPLSSVYRTLRATSSGKRTLHYFPHMDTSNPQLNNAEINRQYVSTHLWPSKE